jgi:hypothetical protein
LLAQNKGEKCYYCRDSKGILLAAPGDGLADQVCHLNCAINNYCDIGITIDSSWPKVYYDAVYDNKISELKIKDFEIEIKKLK